MSVSALALVALPVYLSAGRVIVDSTMIPLTPATAFLAPFARLFRPCRSRDGLEPYVTGLLTDLSRINCDTSFSK